MKELSGFPLAIEQAGALIRDGEFMFSDFITSYKTEYRRLMASFPPRGDMMYDKNRLIITIFDMTYSYVEHNPEHATLLNFIGILGPWKIPLNLIDQFQLLPGGISDCTETSRLAKILHHPSFLRLALRRLANLCLIKIEEDNGRIKAFTMHRLICQWCVEKVAATGKHNYIIQASYGLAKGIFKLTR